MQSKPSYAKWGRSTDDARETKNDFDEVPEEGFLMLVERASKSTGFPILGLQCLRISYVQF